MYVKVVNSVSVCVCVCVGVCVHLCVCECAREKGVCLCRIHDLNYWRKKVQEQYTRMAQVLGRKYNLIGHGQVRLG